MIKLEIRVLPFEIKRVEFSQTLDSIKKDLQEHCSNLFVIKDEMVFCLRMDFKSETRINEILQCKEFRVLSGAISLLSQESEIIVRDREGIKKWSDIDKLRMDYLKKQIEIRTK